MTDKFHPDPPRPTIDDLERGAVRSPAVGGSNRAGCGSGSGQGRGVRAVLAQTGGGGGGARDGAKREAEPIPGS